MSNLFWDQTKHDTALLQETRPLIAGLDWTAGGRADHSVQFYEDDDFLLASLLKTMSAAFSGGETFIVIMTPEHISRLQSMATEAAVDMTSAKAVGQFVAIDAVNTLHSFMVNDNPDYQLFAATIGNVLTRAAKRKAPIRVCSELGVLLWRSGNRTAALNSERFWNDLAKTHHFTLHCAYALGGFNQHEHSDLFIAITSEHDRVLPAESYVTCDVSDPGLRHVAHLQQQSVALHYEVNERVKMELALQRCLTDQEQLVAAGEAKDDFLSIASHQLRTPATAIKQYLDLMLEGYDGPLTAAQREKLQHIHDMNERQIRTLAELLLVARVESGKVQLLMEPCNVVALIDDIIADHAEDFANRSQQVAVTTPATLLALADQRYVRMAIDNIVDNASKYSPNGKSIEVAASQTRQGVRISVRDHGIGIAKKDLQKVGQKFARIENKQSAHITGTGLGLYWAKGVIELHGGELTVSSRPGRGSTFTILLPAA